MQTRKLRHGEFQELAQRHAVWRNCRISSLGLPPPHPLSVLPWALGGSRGWTTSMGSVLSCSWWGLAKGDTTRGRDGVRRGLGTYQASSAAQVLGTEHIPLLLCLGPHLLWVPCFWFQQMFPTVLSPRDLYDSFSYTLLTPLLEGTLCFL